MPCSRAVGAVSAISPFMAELERLKDCFMVPTINTAFPTVLEKEEEEEEEEKKEKKKKVTTVNTQT